MLGFIIKSKRIRLALLGFSLVLLLIGLLSLGNAQATSSASGWNELFQLSQAEKKGLTFYIKGETVPGIVTKVGNDFVEVKNQTHSRILIRLESIDAIAMN